MSRSATLSVALAVAGLQLGCQREADKAAMVIDARGAGAPIAAAQAAAGPASSSPSSPAAAAEPPRDPFVDPLGAATLELSGAVIFPPGPPKAGRVFVFAAIGDCLDPTTVPLRRMPATEDGAFMLHTLATPGSELSICAAVEGGGARGPGLSSTLYGQAQARIRIEKTTDLVLHEVQIPLRVGPPRRFADAKKNTNH